MGFGTEGVGGSGRSGSRGLGEAGKYGLGIDSRVRAKARGAEVGGEEMVGERRERGYFGHGEIHCVRFGP